MALFFIIVVAFLSSLLTLFSGFGLGTVLTPAFGLFFPIQTAIALTGVVHLLNNFFKIGLFRKSIEPNVLFRFGAPSVLGGIVGASVLVWLGQIEPLFSYRIGEKTAQVTALKLAIAALMLFFAIAELRPSFKNKRFDHRFLWVGGLLSGFFGGLSGLQGALRSMFLTKSGLTKEQFIGTGVAIACLVDLARLPIYWSRFMASDLKNERFLIVTATLSAFAGAYWGSKLLEKTTLPAVQKITVALILLFSLALGAGLI